LDMTMNIYEEYSELQSRVEKLEKFIISDEFEKLNDTDRSDLKEQLNHMKSYRSVLFRRVSRTCNNA